MNPTEIMQQFERSDNEFPREALESAIANPAAITPALLEAVQHTVRHLNTVAMQDDYLAPLYPMYLLAQFREPQAFPLFIEILSAPSEMVDALLGDVLTDDMGRMLASVYNGDTEPLEQLIENPAADDFARSAALKALLILVAEGVKTPDELLPYFEQLFREKLPRVEGFIWSALVEYSLELGFAPLYGDIKRAFEDNLVDELFVDLDYVSEQMQKTPEECIELLTSSTRYSYITDTIEEMEQWVAYVHEDEALFEDMDLPFNFPPFPNLPPTPIFQPPPQTVRREEPKIGRNDPCPCGSGLKYKKCHGKRNAQSSNVE